MPFSSPLFDNEIKKILKRVLPLSVLDVGAGAGKYAHLCKETLGSLYLEAIEPDASYIERFKLRELYTTVHSLTAKDYMELRWGDLMRFDLVIMGDVIEHMKKSDGIDILNFLVYRSKWVLVVFPSRYKQEAWEGHKLESHVSVWGKPDFANFECEYIEQDGMNLVLIRGYIE